MMRFELVEPRTLDDAFGLLDRDDPAVRPISGGTALMLMMKAGLFRPLRLVSLQHIAALTGIQPSADGASLRIGAMTTLSTLEQSPDIKRHLPVVTRAMRTLANPRVRNVATVGGNLAHADPHLDLPPIWIALGAAVAIASPRGERRVPVAELATGYYETILRHDELITALHVPIRAVRQATYLKVTTRAAHDWPALGLAVALELRDGVLAELAIVLGAATPMPTRLAQAEAILRGARPDAAALARAGDAAAAEAEIASDDRGSASYKRHLLSVYLGRAVRAALEASTP